MNFDATFFIGVDAILIMFYCLYLVLSLKQNIPGGIISRSYFSIDR